MGKDNQSPYNMVSMAPPARQLNAKTIARALSSLLVYPVLKECRVIVVCGIFNWQDMLEVIRQLAAKRRQLEIEVLNIETVSTL